MHALLRTKRRAFTTITDALTDAFSLLYLRFLFFKKIKSNVALMQNLQIIVVHIEGHWIIMEIFVFCFVYFIL